jgi:hypothetical protein
MDILQLFILSTGIRMSYGLTINRKVSILYNVKPAKNLLSVFFQSSFRKQLTAIRGYDKPVTRW